MTNFISKIPLDSLWQDALKGEFKQDYMLRLASFLEREYSQNVCYPDKKDIFRALNLCSLSEIKVVILGQDPYHGKGQAHGLSFSVQEGVKIPPSLKNIFKEIHRDLHVEIPSSGDLSSWAKQGVLLLNTCLTVEEGKAGSHRKRGWEMFTDKIISTVQDQAHPVVFLLWGNDAIKKEKQIDASKHLVLTSVHPSPLSAYRGFIGNSHFSKANNFLKKVGSSTINW